MKDIKLSLVIPCYNEEKNISLIVEKLKKVLNDKDKEILLVDNGSTDKTRKEIEKYARKFKSLKLVIVEKNIGYGNGIFTGLKAAKGEFIGWTHADLQTNPLDALRAIEILQNQTEPKKSYAKGKRYGRPLMDKLINTWGMSIFETILLGTWMYDINAQPNIFPRALLKEMKSPPIDFSFDLYVYYMAKKRGYKIVRFPVFFGKRLHGVSKWNTGMAARFKFIKRTIAFTFKLKKQLKSN